MLGVLFTVSTCALCLAGPPPAAPPKAVLAVCDFESAHDRGRLGRKIADSLRLKLARYKEDFILIDKLDLADVIAASGVKVGYATDRKALAALARDALDARILLYGKVTKAGERVTIFARALEVTKQSAALYVDQPFAANGTREIPFAFQRIVNAVRRDEAAPDPALDPRSPGPTKPDPKILARPNLLVNGDFEKGKRTPVGWDPVDGLASHWVKAPGRDGKCLMFDTDVDAGQWQAWHRKFTLGTTEKPPKPVRGTGHKYGTVGGTYGAWLYTAAYIPVKPGVTYRLSFDFLSTGGGAKVFVKGYAQFPDQRREVYRMYKACHGEAKGTKWEHFTRTFNPTERTPDVRWIKVEPYVYWPPTRYYFDNIHLCEER